MVQNHLTFVWTHPAHRVGCIRGCGDRLIDRLGIRQGHTSRHVARVFVGHLKVDVGTRRLVGKVERIGLLSPAPIDARALSSKTVFGALAL